MIRRLITTLIGDKRRWRAHRARLTALPEPQRTAAEALERYLMRTGPGKASPLMDMLDDLVEMFERAAADSTPLGQLIGDDPVEFAETFKQNYGENPWMSQEHRDLRSGFERATRIEASR